MAINIAEPSRKHSVMILLATQVLARKGPDTAMAMAKETARKLQLASYHHGHHPITEVLPKM
jgi:hypothetical protein